ncbi:hypothetical protein E2C01_014344 [Portunus trituberculatus]|uniref:Uncharacterized protein n=1 Tax=Portunus trituberculatus TaxID=210409 RepID=A0A5B7DIJ6_PORTR|nr:hypothetical protein [Portunus trituberculatus]
MEVRNGWLRRGMRTGDIEMQMLDKLSGEAALAPPASQLLPLSTVGSHLDNSRSSSLPQCAHQRQQQTSHQNTTTLAGLTGEGEAG